MPFSRGCLGGKVKDLMCSLSTLCLHSVRRDSASQCCFSQERSPVDQCYVLFYEMTSLIELLFVKYTVQASQQIRLFIFPSWKSTWKLPKSALCDVCLITLFLHLACRLLGETWVREYALRSQIWPQGGWQRFVYIYHTSVHQPVPWDQWKGFG